MAFRYLHHAALIATMLPFSQAQQSNIVPEELQKGFPPSGQEIQVSYTNEAVNGLVDGTRFEKDAVSSEPTFALGDSSGISPSTLYTIILVDTTCPSARTLHYARANFKYNFDITNINTSSTPLLEYKAPGAFGETGDDRQYSWLMYTNPKRKEISDLKLPTEGAKFDIAQWQSDNELKDPSAGVGMVVKLGGTASCEGEAVQSTGAGASTNATRTGTESTTVASATATSGVTSTRLLSSITSTGSSTTSGGLPEQTANAASRLVLGSMVVVVPLLVAAGVQLW